MMSNFMAAGFYAVCLQATNGKVTILHMTSRRLVRHRPREFVRFSRFLKNLWPIALVPFHDRLILSAP